jgi:hypothetical protein
MAKFVVEMSGFKGHLAGLNKTHDLAALTLGTPRLLPLVTNPRFAVVKALARSANTFLQLDFSGSSLAIRGGYETLDQSEKTGCSYATGMTAAKVIASELLTTPHLTHAKALEATHTLQRKNPKSKSLADLIGRSKTGDWHVLEAKGRQVLPGSTETDTWKKQAETVSHINGTAVASNSYSVTVIDNPVTAKVVDPEGDNGFGEVYCQAIYDLLSVSNPLPVTVAGRQCVVTPVGLDSEADRVLLVGFDESLLDLATRQSMPSFDSAEEAYSYFGSDGIVVTSRRLTPDDLHPFLWICRC